MKKIILALCIAAGFTGVAFADAGAGGGGGGVSSGTVTLTLRNGDTVFYTGSVPLVDATDPAVSITATGDSTAHDVSALSLTAVLYGLDRTEDSFSLSNLVYYPSFSSFYIKCITGTSELCDNWQYYVNGSAPSAGTDATTLKDGDVVYVYYGSPSRITLSKTAASTGEDFTATAEQYDPVANTFSPRPNVTVGVTTDPFAFPVVTATSSLSDSNGKANFYMNTAGHYEVGVAEDYYFPTTGIDISEPAAVSVKLRVETATTTLFSGTVNVPPCSTSANDRKTLIGFCSFDAAGVTHTETWSAFGALMTSIANQEAGTSYWTLFVNNEPSDKGISSFVPKTNDELLWVLDIPPMKLVTASSTMLSGATTTITAYGFDFNDFVYKPLAGASIEGLATTTGTNGAVLFTATSTATLSLSATKSGYLKSNTIGITTSAAPVVTPPSGGGCACGGGGSNPKPVFSTSRALGFILGLQKPDGSFGAQSFTDWVSIALATQADSAALQKLKTYQTSAVVSPATVLDLERHALALEALNIDPYTAPMNPIASIISNFDGTQIGDSGLDNDDIFAVFALAHAGYAPNDPVMQKIAAAILASQRKDGSWDGSADMTGAAVQALGMFFGPSGVDQKSLGKALGMATGYLASKQQPDGGWTNGLTSGSNSDSTSWVLLSINATTEADPSRASSWQTSSGNTPLDFLGAAQQSDGGVRPLADSSDMRLWSTSYALAAASGKSWLSIPRSFPKPATGGAGGSGGGSNATSSVATSSVAIATSTEATSTATIATSTELMIATTTIATTTPATTTAPIKKKIALRKPAPKVAPRPERLPQIPTTTPMALQNTQTATAATTDTSLITTIFHFFTRIFGF